MKEISGPFFVFLQEARRARNQALCGARRRHRRPNKKLHFEDKNMPMTRPQPINALLVATVSAALHAGTAILFFPLLSFLMLCWGATPVQLKGTIAAASDGMVLAVMAPVIFGVFGFLAGGLAALGHNVFARDQRKRTVEIREPAHARAASFSNVA
jgi:hypothetical protein